MTPPRPGGPHPESGRAGRLRLRHRLEVALRGAELLDRKLAVLRERHRLLAAEEEAARRAWHTAVQEAETWLLRGLLLSGDRALAAVVANRADVVVEWTVSMGVRHPSRAVCTDAARATTEPPPANTALAHAETAYRTVVRTAAGYAAARTAAGLVQAEIDRTGRRVRALRRHWIPRLAEALAHLDQGLEQAEHEDAVRRRWAAGAPGRSPTAGAGSAGRADTAR
ncbi:hypothetical protein HS99_0002305 [Kitasatospora aureofaciens]|uniref:V-type ATPase, D subunit n=1 Tax=Kitasatospora aureofaciens TaxID=1894 RepID=A0A1E7NFW1_KITAU|nr:V-type ATP synthase subunit D [Kitasatospora aureofaciens]OEV39538.1 hypothetical protein HS99_0002305 [Kitasatospora aureofaciens]